MVGRPETIRLAWDAIRPGGSAVVVGLVPRGVEVAVPGIEFLSDKSLRGTYYGSGDAARELPDLARLAVDGELDLAGVVTHTVGLDGVERALRAAQRRRRRADGRGDRRGTRGNRERGAGMTSIVERLKNSEERDSDALVAGLDIRTQAFIDGAYVDALSGETFDCVSPGTGRTIASIASCDAADVDRAVAGARRAFDSGSWSRAAPKQRKRVMRRLATLMEEHADELALLETLDMGKPISRQPPGRRPARRGDDRVLRRGDRQGVRRDRADRELERRDDRARAARRRRRGGAVELPADDGRLEARAGAGHRQLGRPEAGRAVVADGAQAGRAGRRGRAPGRRAAGRARATARRPGRALGLHPDVDMVAFTGSTEVGKLFLRYSGESNMKRLALECGGKSPNVVFPDCGDLDAAAQAAAWGVFYNQGEVCNAGSRLLVHEDIRDEFLERVLKVSAGIRPGDPLDPATKMGAIVDDRQLERVLGYVETGKQEGAGLLLGGDQALRRDRRLLRRADRLRRGRRTTMTIARDEIFGPVMSVISFKDEAEAIAIANDTVYGLAAAIWTDDVNRAHRAARALRAGVVWVNTFDAGDITSPFGGFKQSGFGRDKSIHALDKFTDLKSIWLQLQVTVRLTGTSLDLEQLERVASLGRRVELAEGVVERVQAGREVVLRALDRDEQVYGLTTGVGVRKRTRVTDAELDRVQPAPDPRAPRRSGACRARAGGARAAAAARERVRPRHGGRPAGAARARSCTCSTRGRCRTCGCSARSARPICPRTPIWRTASLDGLELEAKEGLALLSNNSLLDRAGRARVRRRRASARLARRRRAASTWRRSARTSTLLHPEVARQRPYPGLQRGGRPAARPARGELALGAKVRRGISRIR